MAKVSIRLPRYQGGDPRLADYLGRLAQAIEQAFSGIGSSLVTPNAAATIGGAASTVTLQGSVMLPQLPASPSYANDTAAAAGGVPIGEVYRNGSVNQTRIT
jgi:hypothetical protein